MTSSSSFSCHRYHFKSNNGIIARWRRNARRLLLLSYDSQSIHKQYFCCLLAVTIFFFILIFRCLCHIYIIWDDNNFIIFIQEKYVYERRVRTFQGNIFNTIFSAFLCVFEKIWIILWMKICFFILKQKFNLFLIPVRNLVRSKPFVRLSIHNEMKINYL